MQSEFTPIQKQILYEFETLKNNLEYRGVLDSDFFFDIGDETGNQPPVSSSYSPMEAVI